MRKLAIFVLVVAVASFAPVVCAEEGAKKVPAVLNFKMKSIDRQDVDLSKYQGKVVVFVNVASKCGLTPQYKGLQELHDKYAEKGLAIIGVPANEFGGQEPGTNEDIAKFCETRYKVKFDMMGKAVVKGDGICPLYDYLTSKQTDPKHAGPIQWNFTKFIVGRNGEIVARFEPRDTPEKMTKTIEAELEKK